MEKLTSSPEEITSIPTAATILENYGQGLGAIPILADKPLEVVDTPTQLSAGTENKHGLVIVIIGIVLIAIAVSFWRKK